MLSIAALSLLALLPLSNEATHPRPVAARVAPADEPVYVVYFWRARPGRAAEYSAYIRNIAEPIDEMAQKAGVFEEVHTYTPAFTTGA